MLNALVLAGLLASWPTLAAPAAPSRVVQGRFHNRTGLQLYTVRDDCARDFPGTLRAVAEMGFAGVEFAGYYGRSAADLRKMLDDDHLKCFGTHLSLNDLMGDNLDKTIEFNRILGNHLLVVPSLPGARTSSHAALLETAKLLDDLAEKVERRGMMLAYHDHAPDFRMVDGELEWLTIFNNTHRLRIQFDFGNALEGGQQGLPLIQRFPRRLISVHIKDFSTTNSQALLGEGQEDWRGLIPYLKGGQGPRWFIIEQETYPVSPLESAKRCLANFETMLKTY